MSRYARQMILPEVGAAGQDRLARAHVLVVGAGGLGCPVLQYLGGAGVGRITVMDGDVVEESNLHRQVLYTMDDLGRPKAEAARRHLLAANPELEVQAQVQPLDAANAAALVADAPAPIQAELPKQKPVPLAWLAERRDWPRHTRPRPHTRGPPDVI